MLIRMEVFVGLDINSEYREKYVRQIDLWVKENDKVLAFKGANNAIGTLVLQFDSKEELEKALKYQDAWLQVKVN